VYVSPFVGRLDDRGEDGMGLIANIKKMYAAGDGHVHVLAASFRKVEHLLESFALGAELATSPAKILEQWAAAGSPLPDQHFKYHAVDGKAMPLRPIAYKELDLKARWENFDLKHELTDKGIQRFVDDYISTTVKSAA
jgi:transaldolase